MINRLQLPPYIAYLIRMYLLGMLFFSLFRVLLLWISYHFSVNMPERGFHSIQALAMGLVSDAVVSAYILFLPFLVFTYFVFVKGFSKWGFWTGHCLAVGLYLFALLTCSVDISYFPLFFDRLSIVVLMWSNGEGTAVKSTLDNWRSILSFVVSAIPFALFSYWIFKRFISSQLSVLGTAFRVTLFGVSRVTVALSGATGLILIGCIGGNLRNTTNQINDRFCDYAYPNLISLNAAYTFFKSIADKGAPEASFPFKLMDEQEALQVVQSALGVKEDTLSSYSPIARRVGFQKRERRLNVILLLMESMTAKNMRQFGNLEGLTPHLDSIAKGGYLFDRFYSSGVHTNNGIYSAITGYPIVPMQGPMNRVNGDTYNSLPQILSHNGYATVFYATHHLDFDNMEGFLPRNGFQCLYGQDDYPNASVLGTWGVADHEALRSSLPMLRQLDKAKVPFFATYLTTSNHFPYRLPTNVTIPYRTSVPETRAVEYADWAIGDFMDKASREPWFDNTIFVLVADHGHYVPGENYDMPLSFNHIPMIIYSPKILGTKVCSQLGGQVDIPETVLGLLHIPHVNNTFGIDLLGNQRRPFMFFQSDSKMGCVDGSHFLILRNGGQYVGLYNYKVGSVEDMGESEQEKIKQMIDYTISMPQAAQWMIKHEKTKMKDE